MASFILRPAVDSFRMKAVYRSSGSKMILMSDNIQTEKRWDMTTSIIRFDYSLNYLAAAAKVDQTARHSSH
jgi:hypothetical protein